MAADDSKLAVGRGGGVASSHGLAGMSAGSAYSGASFASMLSTLVIRFFMLKKTLPVAPPFGALPTLLLVRPTCWMISSARQDERPIGACTGSASRTRCRPFPIQRFRCLRFWDAHQLRSTG